MLTLKKGNADTWTDTISELSSLSGYTGKCYIYTIGGTLVDTFTGTPSGLTMVYDIKNDDTKDYEVGFYDVEFVVFDSSDHVYHTVKTKLEVEFVRVTNPS